MKIAIASSTSHGSILVEELRNHYEIAYLLTSPDAAQGRSGKLQHSDFVATLPVESDYRIFKPHSKAELLTVVQENPVNIIITLAYGMIVTPEALKVPKHGWLNIHFSLLPKWRGASPVQSSLIAGEKVGGVTIFQLDENLDTGPIYLQEQIQYGDQDKTSDILQKLTKISAQSLPSLLQAIQNGLQPIEQVGDPGEHARKFSSHDGQLTTSQSVHDAYNIFRALSENPGVFINIGDKRLKLKSLNIVSDSSAIAGQFKVSKSGLYLGFSGGYLELLRVVPAGSKEMSGSDFARGARIKDGDTI